jgi:hypothetical protein
LSIPNNGISVKQTFFTINSSQIASGRESIGSTSISSISVKGELADLGDDL